MIDESLIGELSEYFNVLHEKFPNLTSDELLQMAIALKTSTALNQINSRLDSMASKLDQAVNSLTEEVENDES